MDTVLILFIDPSDADKHDFPEAKTILDADERR